MKTKYFLVLLCFNIILSYAQLYSVQDNFLSAPSVSSIPSYVKSPVSLSSGIPDIHVPFFTLPTHNKNISINVGISYHPGNAGRYNKASDAGLGWSLYGATNIIYHDIERNNGISEPDYFYSIGGRNGKFSLVESSTGEVSILKVTNDKLIITATKVNGQYSFKAIDTMGSTYFLDIPDITSNTNSTSSNTFSTTYYISKVVDVNNIEVLKYEYQEDSYTIPSGNNNSRPVKSLKVKKITSPNFGEIILNYNFDIAKRRSFNDPFELSSIELKNKAGSTIDKYRFEFSTVNFSYIFGYVPGYPNSCGQSEVQSKRILNRVLKYNKNSSSHQTTEFTYINADANFENIWSDIHNPNQPCFENEPDNPKYLAAGLLNTIKFPTGTAIKYYYEPNQYYINKNTDTYKNQFIPLTSVHDREAQYFEDVELISFDTHQSSNLLWNLSANPDAQDGASYLHYWVNVTEYYRDPLQGENESSYINVNIPATQEGKNMPGYNSLNITGTGGRGTVVIQRARYKKVPINNFSSGRGVRVKTIEYYDGNTLIPTQTRNYNYQNFNDNTQTSGLLFEYEDVGVVYRNVKESIGNEGGYTKYYFKTLADYSQNLKADGTLKYIQELDYYDVLINGIIGKKEIYDNDNILISQEENDYEYYQFGAGKKKSMLKKHFLTSSFYSGSHKIITNSEFHIDRVDLNVFYVKNTESDGTINEKNITYPWQHSLVDSRLWDKNITTIPLIVETKKNGTVVSKSETKFEDTSHFYPTSQLSFLPDNLSQSLKNASFDIYDDKGNLVQYTAFPQVGNTGVSTTIIYGYNKTLPIAKIEGAKLSDIPAHLITAIVNASNEDANASAAQEEAKEKALIAALNSFKNNTALKNFMVTCYTYNPLVGLTTAIPPNGLMELYKYDSFNRLLKVVDVNGNTVKEHLYHYKN